MSDDRDTRGIINAIVRSKGCCDKVRCDTGHKIVQYDGYSVIMKNSYPSSMAKRIALTSEKYGAAAIGYVQNNTVLSPAYLSL